MDIFEYQFRSVINNVSRWIKPDWSDLTVEPDKMQHRVLTFSERDEYRFRLDAIRYVEGILYDDDNVPTKPIQDAMKEIKDNNLKTVFNAFDSVNFNMEQFLWQRKYLLIPNEQVRANALMHVFLPNIEPINEYVFDWFNGYVDFDKRDRNLSWDGKHPLTDTDILLHIIERVKTIQDLWNMMGTGVGDIELLFKFYMGYTPFYGHKFRDCAYGMLRNIILRYEREHKYSSFYRTPYAKQAHDVAYDLLVNYYLRLYDDNFFTDSNWPMIQRAWYSGVHSIVEYMMDYGPARKYVDRLRAFYGLKKGDEFEVCISGHNLTGVIESLNEYGFSIYVDQMRRSGDYIVSPPEMSYRFARLHDGEYYTNWSACRAADLMLCKMLWRYMENRPEIKPFFHPAGKIQLTNGAFLDCYPKGNDSTDCIERDKVSKEQLEKEQQLFKQNAFLILDNADRILKDSRMFLCPFPYTSMLDLNNSGHRLTLGMMLEWWQTCQYSRFTGKNGERCLVFCF